MMTIGGLARWMASVAISRPTTSVSLASMLPPPPVPMRFLTMLRVTPRNCRLQRAMPSTSFQSQTFPMVGIMVSKWMLLKNLLLGFSPFRLLRNKLFYFILFYFFLFYFILFSCFDFCCFLL